MTNPPFVAAEGTPGFSWCTGASVFTGVPILIKMYTGIIMEQSKEKNKESIIIDKKQATSDAKILTKAKEIVEDIDRLSAAKLIDSNLCIVDSCKGKAWKGSKSLDVVAIQESKDNPFNVFKKI